MFRPCKEEEAGDRVCQSGNSPAEFLLFSASWLKGSAALPCSMGQEVVFSGAGNLR